MNQGTYMGGGVGWYAIATSTWIHFAFTTNGSLAQMYLNGNLVVSVAQPTARNVNRTNNYLGFTNSYQANVYPPSDADFDEVKIFNRMLTPQQVANDMSMNDAYIIIL
jgi:hypothetical protein